jgi:hypothetical protein
MAYLFKRLFISGLLCKSGLVLNISYQKLYQIVWGKSLAMKPNGPAIKRAERIGTDRK